MNIPDSSLSTTYYKMDFVIGTLVKDMGESKKLMKEMVKCLNGEFTPKDKKKLLAKVQKAIAKIEKDEPEHIINNQ